MVQRKLKWLSAATLKVEKLKRLKELKTIKRIEGLQKQGFMVGRNFRTFTTKAEALKQKRNDAKISPKFAKLAIVKAIPDSRTGKNVYLFVFKR